MNEMKDTSGDAERINTLDKKVTAHLECVHPISMELVHSIAYHRCDVTVPGLLTKLVSSDPVITHVVWIYGVAII
jgi:hypothetical protein